MKLIHIGDTVSYGVDVNKVSFDEIRANRVCFTLDNGHWAYSEQVDEAGGEKV